MKIKADDEIMVLGSCFAANIGAKLQEAGYDVCLNPFGTIFNPASISNSIKRLESGIHFTEEDCIEMGAGAGKICSFYHHTSFARVRAEDFLENANCRLDEASAFWKGCNKVLVTFGTAQVWKWKDGRIVSNCLKRPGYEFRHEMLSLEEIEKCISDISSTGKECLFTVSPIRHMGEGAHVNTVSKSLLQVGIAELQVDYFPAYEIMLDELRDYRWYAEDRVHPTQEAVDYIWNEFQKSTLI
ncbi:MAG: GSCFA domain-containing protein [Bacteroidales bacterium]|nr:GSCFA domain-containing protein [Bacteroidales bacterium]